VNASAVAPFPWKSLETLPRSSVIALRDAHRWAARHLRLEAFGRAMEDLVGAPVRVRVRRATPRAAGPALAGAIGVLVAHEGETDRVAAGPSTAAASLEVEVALAASLVARAIRRPSPSIVDGSRAPSVDRRALAGAFAAVVMAAARRSLADAPLRILSAGPAEELEAAFVGDGREVMSLSLTVLVADDAYDARLVIARDAVVDAEPTAWTLHALGALGATPLSLPVVACATRATVADVAALRQGDVWMPGTWSLTRSGSEREEREEGTLRGAVLLAAPASGTGLRAELVEGGRLVLSGEVDAVCAGEGDMTEADGKDALLNAVGDVPVVVRVEIGEARMPAREWASLGRGDVVTLGRRVGELVLLRVGGVAVARGELVSVDGEVGVRVVERLASDASGAPTER